MYNIHNKNATRTNFVVPVVATANCCFKISALRHQTDECYIQTDFLHRFCRTYKHNITMILTHETAYPVSSICQSQVSGKLRRTLIAGSVDSIVPFAIGYAAAAIGTPAKRPLTASSANELDL